MYFWIAVLILIIVGYLGSLQTSIAKQTCGCNNLYKKLDRLERELHRKVECPTGFIRSRNYCYLFMMSNKKRSDWGDAKDYCNEHGANLVTIDNKRQEQFVYNHFKKNFYNIDGPNKLYTGLIYTDSKAKYPHDPHHGQSRGIAEGNSIRWTATRRAVNTSLMTYDQPRMARWSPADIQGVYTGPKGVFMSCVVLFWESGKKPSLVWRFNSCYEEKLHFICEVRLSRETPSRQRQKRDVAIHKYSTNQNSLSLLPQNDESMGLNGDVNSMGLNGNVDSMGLNGEVDGSFSNNTYFDDNGWNQVEHGNDGER